LFLKRLAGAVFRHRRDCDGILAELGDSWENRARAAEVPHGGRGRRVEDGLELSKRMVARWLMVFKDNLLVIRMDVAGLTQWGSSWLREGVCGRVEFERIVENCGKDKRPHVQSRHMGHPAAGCPGLPWVYQREPSGAVELSRPKPHLIGTEESSK